MSPKRTPTDHPDIVAYPNGIRYARISINGKRVEMSLHTNSQREAKERLKSLLRDIDPSSNVKGALRVEDVYSKFIDDKKSNGENRQRTLDEYDFLFSKHLLPFFRYQPLKDINKDLWDKYSKTKTIKLKNHKKVFGHFLRWCVKEGYINGVPELPVKKYKTKKGHALTEEQLNALVSQCKTPKLLVFCLMYLYMAMRSREITALEWSRVDFEKRVIYLGDEHVKNKRERWVPMHDDVMAILVMMKKASKSPFVFPMRGHPKRPTCTTGIYRSFNTAKKKAGIDFDISPHDFRHTWNTEAHMDPNATDAAREEFAGSRTLVQKGTYVHLKIERLRPLANVIKHPSLDKVVENRLSEWGKTWGKRK